MRILLFGDIPGIPQLLSHVPKEYVVGIVGAVIRPQYCSELRKLASRLHVPFMVQPKWQSSDYPSFRMHVQSLCPDLIWANSYSMIIREDLLAIPRLGGINIHAALLPRNRGCNPIQWAILNGDSETGVTLHQVTSGIDEGPIIDQWRIPLFFEDTWIDVKSRLTRAADDLIKRNLDIVLSGIWTTTPQSERGATVGRRRYPGDGVFTWTEPVCDIYNKIRALLPPLPPAFWVDGDDRHHEMTQYRSIWQVASEKYGEPGGGQDAV